MRSFKNLGIYRYRQREATLFYTFHHHHHLPSHLPTKLRSQSIWVFRNCSVSVSATIRCIICLITRMSSLLITTCSCSTHNALAIFCSLLYPFLPLHTSVSTFSSPLKIKLIHHHVPALFTFHLDSAHHTFFLYSPCQVSRHHLLLFFYISM